MATEPESTTEKTRAQKRGIIRTVVILAILAGIGFASAFLKEWQ